MTMDAPALLSSSGVTAARETALGWFLLLTASAVVAVVAVLVLLASFRSRRKGLEVTHGDGSGMSWVLVGGIAVPTVILVGAFIFTAITLWRVASPPTKPAATIEVVGHQWWWEVHYTNADPSRTAVTANELHLPVGQPVLLRLETADVIHSFWVPQLAGKTDLIPGQTNVSWIQATEPGTYLGRCGEFCGVQHAHMQLRVVAESPAKFQAWLASQRGPAAAPATPAARAGLDAFLSSGCANCHTIRGTPAGGAMGPDLTHLAARHTIAAGTLPNTRGNLAGWIADAQGIKPGALMPTMAVAPDRLQALLTYLESLK